jgi:hypothetical protein
VPYPSKCVVDAFSEVGIPEMEFSEAHLITFITNITRLGDTLAAIEAYAVTVTWEGGSYSP